MQPPRAIVPLALVAVSLITLSALGIQSDAPEDEPLPFDPLSTSEQEQAIQATLSNETVKDALSDRVEVIGAALYTDKSFQEVDTWPRMAETWLFDYEANHAIRALVNLDANEVTHVETSTIQPPLTANEVDHAGQLALGADEVNQRLDERGLHDAEWTARLWTGTGPTACPEHRCAQVAFFQGETYVHEFTVLIDLVDETIREILELAPNEEEGVTL